MMTTKVSRKNKDVDKRQFFRLPHEFKVNFKPLEFPLSDHKRQESTVKDVSGGGLLFASNTIFEIGSILQLDIVIEGWHRHRSSFFKSSKEKIREPLTVIGEVARIEKFDDNTYDIGVKFTNVYDDDHVSLLKFIESKKNR